MGHNYSYNVLQLLILTLNGIKKLGFIEDKLKCALNILENSPVELLR